MVQMHILHIKIVLLIFQTNVFAQETVRICFIVHL